jgi:hypothetical protein
MSMYRALLWDLGSASKPCKQGMKSTVSFWSSQNKKCSIPCIRTAVNELLHKVLIES